MPVDGSKGDAKIPNGNVPLTDSTSPGCWPLMLICAKLMKPPSKSSMSLSVSDRIVEADRDRVDAEREAGRQGGGVVIGRIAGDGVIAVRKIDDIQDRRGRRIALIGDDLVTGVIEIEARQRDDGTGSNRGGRRVGDCAFARPESAGGQPAIVGEIDDGACLDVTPEDKRERVCGAAVVLNDGDVAGGENGGHDDFLSGGSRLRKRRVEILSARNRREGAAIFSEDRSTHGTTLRWLALVLSVSLPAIYDRTARRLRPRVLCADGGCGDELCPTKAERASNRFM